MAQLAIKGHRTRFGEVIQLLEMLGGKNTFHRLGTETGLICYLDDKNSICQMQINDYNPCSNYTIFTLEEFLEKFPYKVGDKVQHNGATSCGSVYVIEQMKWEDNQVKYVICDLYWKNCKCTVTSKDLQPYKEETMEENRDEPKAPILSNRYDYAEGKCGYVIPDGYEFDYIKEGFQTEIILKPKKPTYPKYYTECEASRLSSNPVTVALAQGVCMGAFAKLIVIRNAYWEIAGKELGLDKPWEPDWTDLTQKYCIWCCKGKVDTLEAIYTNKILAFPTEEMRDAFYENFKEEIEMCKEML